MADYSSNRKLREAYLAAIGSPTGRRIAKKALAEADKGIGWAGWERLAAGASARIMEALDASRITVADAKDAAALDELLAVAGWFGAICIQERDGSPPNVQDMH